MKKLKSIHIQQKFSHKERVEMKIFLIVTMMMMLSLSCMEADTSELDQQITDIKSEISAMDTRIEENSTTMQSSIDGILEIIVESTPENTARIDDLRDSNLPTVPHLADSISRITGQYALLETAFDSLQVEMDILQADNESLHDDIDDLESEVDDLSSIVQSIGARPSGSSSGGRGDDGRGDGGRGNTR